MRAAVLHALGELPRSGEFPVAVPGDGEELIEVTAAAWNPGLSAWLTLTWRTPALIS